MGMAFGLEKKVCNDSNIELAKTMVPKALEPYVTGKVLHNIAAANLTRIDDKAIVSF